MKEMFSKCRLLTELYISNWKTSKIKDMSNLFNKCKSLKRLPDIPNWNTQNLESMSSLFNECESLESIPDISKWDTSKVKDMSNLFNKCKSLKRLRDISEWKTPNLENMSNLFNECISLESLPELSKWNTSNVKYMNNLFNKCESLVSLPDISKWNTSNVIDMSNLFNKCIKLKYLPDISKWEKPNLENMNNLFNDCKSLKSLPDISKWKTPKIKKMNNSFNESESLERLSATFFNLKNQKIEDDLLYFVCQNFKKFIDILKQLQNLNLDLPDVNTIEIYFTQKILISIPVIIIETQKLKYCLTNINYSDYSKLNQNDFIKMKNTFKTFNIVSNIEIISYNKILDNIHYSFVNEDFCNNLKIKYNQNDIAYYYLNKSERFIYFYNQKKLLKVINYNDNTFFLSKPALKNPIPALININNSPFMPQKTQISFEKKRSIGLQNIGTNSYMNATLQCLSNISSFKNYFINENKIKNDALGRPTPIAKAFYELINNL